jgi:hypothetical protein
MSADETKVGHGFEGDDPKRDYCHASVETPGTPLMQCCGQPRSAHPGEETRPWGLSGNVMILPATAGIAEEPSEEEIAEAVRLARQAPAQLRGWSHLTAYEKMARALLRVRSEGGGEKRYVRRYLGGGVTIEEPAPSGEKGWQQGYRAGLETAAKVADSYWAASNGAEAAAADIRALPIPEPPK